MDGGLPPLDEGLLTRLLERALERGGDYADVFAESSRSQVLRWEEGRVKEADLDLQRGVGVRVLSGEKTGYAYSDVLTEDALLAAAATAAHIAAGGGAPAPAPRVAPGLPDRYPDRRPLADADLAEKVALLEGLEAVAAAEPEVERHLASYAETVQEVLVATSDGVLARDRRPLLRLNCTVVAARNGRRETARRSMGGRAGMEFFDANPVADLAREAAGGARRLLDADAAPAGPMPVILGAATSGILLHEAVGHGLEADFNRKGTSRFTDRVGERVASELCTVVDDPGFAGDRGALNVDDEGRPAERTVLIEKGVLQGYLHDRLSARLMKAAPTGNGRRESYRHHPLPRMTCTLMPAGDSDVADLFRAVKRGFYAKSFSGGQVDIARGDFVFNVTEGYLVEDGRVTAPVKGATLIGNGPEIMGRVSMVAGDFALSPGMWNCGKRGQGVPVNVGLPHVLISEITVGGTRGSGAP